MAIALVAGSNVSTALDATGATLSVNVGSGSDRLLVVAIVSDETTDVNTLTYAGAGLTEAADYAPNDQDPARVWIYYKIAPATGANDLVLDFVGNASPDFAMMAAAFTDVLQVSPLDDISSVDDTASPFALVVTPSTND